MPRRIYHCAGLVADRCGGKEKESPFRRGEVACSILGYPPPPSPEAIEGRE
jgi:hypothetical protein